MKCSNCGAAVVKNQVFCASCGSRSEFENTSTYKEETKSANSNMKVNSESMLKFDKMITPSIIQILFYLGIFVALIVSIVLIGVIGGLAGLLTGVLTFLVLSIVSRVNCEIIIVVFKIHESLVAIRNK